MAADGIERSVLRVCDNWQYSRTEHLYTLSKDFAAQLLEFTVRLLLAAPTRTTAELC